MSLPLHLEPKTYWEHRCSLLEIVVHELIKSLTHAVPAKEQMILVHNSGEWNRLLGELRSMFAQEKK